MILSDSEYYQRKNPELDQSDQNLMPNIGVGVIRPLDARSVG